MNKIFALLIAMVMVLSMSTSVFAATIEIKDAPEGADYTAYKIFDATVDGDAVSYTIPEGSTLTAEILEATDLFDVVNNGEKTYVSVKEGASDSDVIDWLKMPGYTYGIKMDAEYADGKIVNLDSGYYYVKSTVNNGAVVMLGSATDTAVIHEKNDVPGWGENGGKTADGETYMVGDTITYKLSYENALNYNNGEKVYQYVVEDTMPEGIELNEDSYVIKVNDVPLTESTVPATGTYRIDSQSADGFKIIIPWAASETPATDSGVDDFYYTAPAKIEVEYTAVLKSDAAEGSFAENTNQATINPNTSTSDPGKTVDVYDGSITIEKISGDESKTPLAGAIFVVKNEKADDANNGKYLAYDAVADDYSWVDDIADATKYETAADGTVVISGLAAGSYRLVEIKAPEGYNLLPVDQCPIVHLVKAEEGAANDTLVVTKGIENNAGTILPSTGGMGTTILYVVGGIMVVAAVVLLFVKRRVEEN